MTEASTPVTTEIFKVSVKHGAETLQVELPRGGNVSILMEKLVALTNIPARGQKLIHKGVLQSSPWRLDFFNNMMCIGYRFIHISYAEERVILSPRTSSRTIVVSLTNVSI